MRVRRSVVSLGKGSRCSSWEVPASRPLPTIARCFGRAVPFAGGAGAGWGSDRHAEPTAGGRADPGLAGGQAAKQDPPSTSARIGSRIRRTGRGTLRDGLNEVRSRTACRDELTCSSALCSDSILPGLGPTSLLPTNTLTVSNCRAYGRHPCGARRASLIASDTPGRAPLRRSDPVADPGMGRDGLSPRG